MSRLQIEASMSIMHPGNCALLNWIVEAMCRTSIATMDAFGQVVEIGDYH